MATNRSLLRQCGRPCFSCCCCCCCSFCCFVFLCIHFMCCRCCCRCSCCCFCRGNAAQKQNIRQAVKTRQVRPVGEAGGAAPREGALEGSLLSAAHSWPPPHTAAFYGTDTDTELALKLNASRTLPPYLPLTTHCFSSPPRPLHRQRRRQFEVSFY